MTPSPASGRAVSLLLLPAFLSVLTFPAVSVIIILVEAFSVGDKPRSFRTKPAVSEVSLLSRILIGTA